MEIKNWKFIASLAVAGGALFGVGVYQIELAIKPVEILIEKNSQAIKENREAIKALTETVNEIANKVNRIEGYLIGRNGYEQETAGTTKAAG